jgi:hypothetical protein
MRDPLQIANALRLAADHLREHGWIQGHAHEGKKSCLMGAVGQTSGEDAYEAVLIHFGGYDIFAWNDKPGRTLEEVLERLEATTVELERELVAV